MSSRPARAPEPTFITAEKIVRGFAASSHRRRQPAPPPAESGPMPSVIEWRRAQRAGLTDPLFSHVATAAMVMGRRRYSPTKGEIAGLAFALYSMLQTVLTLVYRLRAMARRGEGAAAESWARLATAAVYRAERSIEALAPDDPSPPPSAAPAERPRPVAAAPPAVPLRARRRPTHGLDGKELAA